MCDYSPMIVKAVYNFLTSEEWHFSYDKEKGSFSFALGLDGRISKVDYFICVHRNQLISYAISPVNVDINDREQLLQMSEFLHRANYGLANGNFELDMRDGEIRYKSFVDCDGCTTPPSANVIRNSILVPAMMFNRYNAGIIKIIFNGATAADVIKEIERPGRFPWRPDTSLGGDDSAAFDPLASLLRDEDMDPQVRAMLECMARDDEPDDAATQPMGNTGDAAQETTAEPTRDTETGGHSGDGTADENSDVARRPDDEGYNADGDNEHGEGQGADGDNEHGEGQGADGDDARDG